MARKNDIGKMAPSERAAAAQAEQQVRALPNSLTPAFPSFDMEGIYKPGISKTEYVTAQLIAAWVQAHGRIPNFDELQKLMELAILSLNVWMPEASRVEENEFDGHEVDPASGQQFSFKA